MKTFAICALVALGALCSMPAVAAGPALDKAVALAAKDSGAQLSDICNAVYKAVKESPEEAHVVLSSVLAARANWTSGEVYAILRAVLLARPELEDAVRSNIAVYAPNPAEDKPMHEKLIEALHTAALPAGVLPAVVNAVVNNVGSLERMNEVAMSGLTGGSHVGDADPVSPSADIPTPAPMSPQN